MFCKYMSTTTHNAGDGVLAAGNRLHVVLERLPRAGRRVEVIRIAAANIEFPATPELTSRHIMGII